jgi:hypothetical protein
MRKKWDRELPPSLLFSIKRFDVTAALRLQQGGNSLALESAGVGIKTRQRMFCCSSSMTDYAMMKEYGKQRVGLVVCGVTSKPPSIIPSLRLSPFHLLFKQKTILCLDNYVGRCRKTRRDKVIDAPSSI